ncbi:MAG: A/G-specific adenine glycosylase [Gammaproteobacteria bacterium]|nr:A/G-specific adenine glycosylase [Gammaproteobacteria bacterium]
MRQNKLFAQQLLEWFDQHGRHDLPWQHPRSLYRVWLSEIMLQQTQVKTATPYFERFVEHFPSISHLAKASEDEVLHLWSGLGYYARARNLHKAAQIIQADHNGQFPQEYEQVLSLPGIGRSTAGAILAQAVGQRHAILDGNVKRVLTRLNAIEGWTGLKAIENQLWALSEAMTPSQRVADYTQAIMDLGATVCKRSKPRCSHCPHSSHCIAFREGDPGQYPTSKPRKTLPVKQTCMLLLRNTQGHILLHKRPPSGIWGGLWSLPEVQDQTDLRNYCQHQFGLDIQQIEHNTVLRHTFSHYHLEITPVTAQAKSRTDAVMESADGLWYNIQQPDNCGLPAPVKHLLAMYA